MDLQDAAFVAFVGAGAVALVGLALSFVMGVMGCLLLLLASEG